MARHRLIACEVFHREFLAVLAETPNEVDVEFVPQGLHDRRSKTMAGELQRRIERWDEAGYDALLLGYGLCNNGIAGLRARRTPLIVPRAHDCITLFLGSRHRYQEVFKKNPGSYYLTSGWIERASGSVESLPSQQQGQETRRATYEDYVERFGEENARYLMETMGGWKEHYERMVFIDLGLGDVEAYREHTRQQAQKRSIAYQEMRGELRLFRGLVNGPPWDEEDYLVVPPGNVLRPSYDDQVVEARAEEKERDPVA